jgi:hypothetical protein
VLNSPPKVGAAGKTLGDELESVDSDDDEEQALFGRL